MAGRNLKQYGKDKIFFIMFIAALVAGISTAVSLPGRGKIQQPAPDLLIPLTASIEKETTEKKGVAEEKPTEEYYDIKAVEAMQAESLEAAIDARPIEGEITERPEFVSEIEWEVLQSVAEQENNSAAKLSHFVSKMLFFKKREAWQTMFHTSKTPDKRLGLAKELLSMIPAQVSSRAIGNELAATIENELLEDLNSL